MKKRYYFAYGANMCPQAMYARCPQAEPVGAFTLEDWQLEFYAHATIEPSEGSKVEGVLWEITPECEQALDHFEGYPTYYTKRTWRQAGREFFFYEMNDYKTGAPSAAYVANIVKSYGRWGLERKDLDRAIRESVEREYA